MLRTPRATDCVARCCAGNRSDRERLTLLAFPRVQRDRSTNRNRVASSRNSNRMTGIKRPARIVACVAGRSTTTTTTSPASNRNNNPTNENNNIGFRVAEAPETPRQGARRAGQTCGAERGSGTFLPARNEPDPVRIIGPIPASGSACAIGLGRGSGRAGSRGASAAPSAGHPRSGAAKPVRQSRPWSPCSRGGQELR